MIVKCYCGISQCRSHTRNFLYIPLTKREKNTTTTSIVQAKQFHKIRKYEFNTLHTISSEIEKKEKKTIIPGKHLLTFLKQSQRTHRISLNAKKKRTHAHMCTIHTHKRSAYILRFISKTYGADHIFQLVGACGLRCVSVHMCSTGNTDQFANQKILQI